MKRCPTCKRTFNEEQLSFCLDDGTPLVTATAPNDESTVVRTAADGIPTQSSPSPGASGARDSAYQQPGTYIAPGSYVEGNRRTWPWILAILAIVFVVFAGLAIAAAVLIPRMMKASNTDTNLNANVERRSNSNVSSANSNSNLNANSNSANWNANSSSEEDTALPPTDEAEVLSTLTDLEHEWTVANINADKKKLERILADDYVGTSEGKAQGKAEYLRTIKRDTSIQKWAFEDLKVTLKGDRATLTGTIQLDVKDQQGQINPLAFRFTDKFVWRDGRWQATGSEVEPVKEGQ